MYQLLELGPWDDQQAGAKQRLDLRQCRSEGGSKAIATEDVTGRQDGDDRLPALG
jgi:hypothetical protein